MPSASAATDEAVELLDSAPWNGGLSEGPLQLISFSLDGIGEDHGFPVP